MQKIVFSLYYMIILIAFMIGIYKYRNLDSAMRVIVILLLTMSISELLSYITTTTNNYDARSAIYHVYNIVEMFLQSLFFIYAIRPKMYYRLIVLNAILWPLIGVLNMLFLQPINQLNSNMLMFESFGTITMSLYFIYWLLRKDVVKNIFKLPHFWIAICLLVLWSSSFFYWAFIGILYHDFNSYYVVISYAQAISNIVTLGGIGAVLFFYKPLKLQTVEDR